MIILKEFEIEAFKILFIGIFLGWHIRSAWGVPKKHAKWLIVKNIRWPYMNIRMKK